MKKKEKALEKKKGQEIRIGWENYIKLSLEKKKNALQKKKAAQGRTKKNPFEKTSAAKKKKRAEKGHLEKSPLEKKRAVKNKKKQGERPFFVIHKIGALDWAYPRFKPFFFVYYQMSLKLC